MGHVDKLCTNIRIRIDLDMEMAVIKYQREKRAKLGHKKYSKLEAGADLLGDLLKKIPVEQVCVSSFCPQKVDSPTPFKNKVELRLCVDNEINGAIRKFQDFAGPKVPHRSYMKPEAAADLFRELLKRV